MKKRSLKLVLLLTSLLIIFSESVILLASESENKYKAKLISDVRNTVWGSDIPSGITAFYNTLERPSYYFYETDKFNCNASGCQSLNFSKIGLISSYEYNLLGGNQSYLKNNSDFFSINDYSIQVITPESIYNASSDSPAGIRPVLYIKNNINITGSGTPNDPFILNEEGDLIIARATLNGSPLKNFPSINDPYIIKDVTCTNGSKGYYDEETGLIKLTKVNLPTSCVVDFKEGNSVSVIANNGTVSAPSTKVIGRIGTATFNVNAKTGFTSTGAIISCTNGAIGTLSGSTFTIKNITKNTECTINMKELGPYQVNVTSTITSYGTVSPITQTVKYGADAVITLNPKSGYIYKDNTCGGIVNDNTLTIKNVKSDKDCTVTFATPHTVKVTSTNTSYGTITNGTQTVADGNSVNITLNPASGYGYKSNTCGGIVNGNTLTISNITSNKTCTVTYAKKYNVVARSNDTTIGTITPATQSVVSGNTATIKLSPISNRLVKGKYSSNTCGGTVSDNILTIPNVTSDINCIIYFKDELATEETPIG